MAAEPHAQWIGPSGRLARWGPASDLPLAALALAVIPVVLLEEQGASATVRTAATVANWVIWLTFVADFLLRWASAEFRGRFLRRAWVDLLIITITVPVASEVLRGALALRAVRVLRLVRLVRIGGVALLTFRRYRAALVRRRFHYVTAIAAAVVGLGALGLYFLEGDQNPAVDSVGDALWWAIVTATTVGYGDISPTTLEGRAIAVVLMLVGIGVIGLFTATVSGYMFSSEEGGVSNAELAERLDRIERLLADMRSAGEADAASGREGDHGRAATRAGVDPGPRLADPRAD